ncbi:phosphatase-related [Plasmodium yoelii yoelii]|uniref:Phosphatase-related n=1 Tax=Plasmodium yoelii yoelii TaxID=73239 RepID=Q7RMW2_PLAYO|nr:phosphatase-related [Plasmodium yoelii yoelii]
MLRKKDAEKNENKNEKEIHISFYNKLKKRNEKKKKLKQHLCCSFKLYNLRRNGYFNFYNFPKKLLICRKCIFTHFEINVVANIIFMRHGARTPKKKIKNIWPFVEKKGDLTYLGFEQSIKIGEYLREHYHSLKKLNKRLNKRLNKKHNKKRCRHVGDDNVFKFFEWNEEHPIKEMLNYFICVKKMNSTERPLFMNDRIIENCLFLNYINYFYFHKKHLVKKKIKNYDIKKKKKKYDKFIKLINKYLSIRTTNSERCKLTAYAIICGILGINKNIYISFFLLKYINNINFFQDMWKIFKIFYKETFNNYIYSHIWNIWWNKNKKGLENYNFIFSYNVEKTLNFDSNLCYYKNKYNYTKIIQRYDLFMNIISFTNFYINIFFYFLKILYILSSIVKVSERDTYHVTKSKVKK